jgi:hypothetical protein
LARPPGSEGVIARWHIEAGLKMPDTPAKLAEHYRKLASEEVAMAKLALTNEARARHYAKAAEYWKLADATQDRIANSE